MLRLYVQYTIPDARANIKKKYFGGLGLKNNIGAVRVTDCYTIDAKLDKKQIQKAKTLLANPLMQKAYTDADKSAGYSPKRFDCAIEIGFLPGVTDNVGSTAKETLADGAKVKFKPGQNVYSSQAFFVHLKIKNRERSADLSDEALAKLEALAKADISKIADSLYNPLIQSATVKSFEQFKKDGGLDAVLPKVKLSAKAKVAKVDLNISDDELTKLGKLGIPDRVIARSASDEAILSKKGIATSARQNPGLLAMTEKRRGPLALGLAELKVIRNYFNKIGRKPTDVELETLAQTWSEHCKHTIFADPLDEIKDGIFKHYIKAATETIRKQKGRGDFCVSVFTDNAGGIIFDKDHIVCHKVETHNTPSALDPFGGSITGIGGVNRDVLGFGLGARPIANFYGFCLAEPGDKTRLYRDKKLQSPMLPAKRIMEGVIAGINAGGNQSGIPTPLGFLYFDANYRGKPLVFAGTLGLSPKKIGNRKAWEKQAKPGDLIVTLGGRVGADGIHGATFASEGLASHSPATAVQIGDPITQKKFSDAVIKEARSQNLYNSITDCGAGGLSSAVGEMAGQAGGCEVFLDKVPLKYPGLAPWQIWISESQERMVLAVPKNKWPKLQKLMAKRGVEAAVIGQFTRVPKCLLKHKNKTVLDIDMDFLHNGRPVKLQITQPPVNSVIPSASEGSLKLKSVRDSSSAAVLEMAHENFGPDILKLLSRPNIASTEFVSSQYDHEVQGSSVLKPLQGRGKINSETAVIAPVLNSKKALVLSYGLHPSYSEINPYNMAACSIDSAVRAAVAAGANIDYLALLDNFCWLSPEDPGRLWQLKQAAKACYDVATAYGTPFISGKDSMYNDFKGFSAKGGSASGGGAIGTPLKISIPPTLLISALGVVPDAGKTVSLDAKLPGDFLYILGTTGDELDGSEYLQMIGASQHNTPSVDAAKNYLLYKSLYNSIQNNLAASAVSINRGGLAMAVCKTLTAGGLGADINLAAVPGNWQEIYQALFSESQGRILAGVAPQNAAAFEKLMSGNVFAKIGKVTLPPVLKITDKNQKLIVKLKIADALKAYKSTFKDY